jgi:hypothetical protein
MDDAESGKEENVQVNKHRLAYKIDDFELSHL